MHVYMTSEEPQNPYVGFDQEEDDATWFNTVDRDELTDAEFVESWDGWFHDGELYYYYCFDGTLKTQATKQMDLVALQLLLGWKPLDIVHKPIPATTQFDDPAT